MSIDPSLKLKGALVRHRNVLNRAERIEKLKEDARWEEGDNIFGLPKVANRKLAVGKKTKEEKAEGEAAAAAPGAAAPAAAPAAGAKAAAPAAGAKPAAKAAAKPAAGKK